MKSETPLDIPAEVIQALPKEAACAYNVLPFRLDHGRLTILAAANAPPSLASDLAFMTGNNIFLEEADDDLLRREIGRYYGKPSGDGPHTQITRSQLESDPQPESGTGISISAVATVSRMISDAIQRQASDIHVEPYERYLRIRYRLDGVLQEVSRHPVESAKAIVSRLKIMSDLDIAEKRRPQDGRIRVVEQGRTIDIRVSALPTDFGEKIVLRILDKTQLRLDLQSLGFRATDLHSFEQAIRLPFGMILVTGPTGSGKTTTLYAALNTINHPQVNITTIEDPIEYNLPGINQTQVRTEIGLSFAAILRSILRQDPNVIMVGEIRDAETAEIAIRAALTGHLVFSTLHTNDAPSAITRLTDMGIEPFIVASSVRMILAQRLLRKICPHCARPFEPPQPQGVIPDTSSIGLTYVGKGCPHCNETGYKGRTAVYEVLPVDNGLSNMIARGALAHEIRTKAKELGVKSLRDSALLAAQAGITSLEEVLRETVA